MTHNYEAQPNNPDALLATTLQVRLNALRPGRHEDKRWSAHVALMEEWGVIPVGAVEINRLASIPLSDARTGRG